MGTGVGVHPSGATSFVSRSPQGLGKRSAEEAAPAEDDKVYGTGHNSYVGQTVWGARGKRSAEAEPEADAYYGYGGYGGYYGHGLYGYGYGHQLGWPSYSAPGFTSTVWGARGKRSAEPSAEPHGYGFYLYHPHAFKHHVAAIAAPEGAGVGVHPGGATSFVSRSPQGLGKRSAEEAAPA